MTAARPATGQPRPSPGPSRSTLALRELAAAGCPLIEIHEPAATTIGADEAERALFREAHLRLLDGVEGSHLSLALTGGNADAAGIETLLAAPYASLAVDLIAGPDNWRLVAATPGDRGIVCGALSAGARFRRRAGAPAVGRRLRGLDRRARTGSRRAGQRIVASPTCRGKRPSASSSGSARRRAWPTSRVDDPRALARSARRQQPERGARSRRSAAVPRPGPG